MSMAELSERIGLSLSTCPADQGPTLDKPDALLCPLW